MVGHWFVVMYLVNRGRGLRSGESKKGACRLVCLAGGCSAAVDIENNNKQAAGHKQDIGMKEQI